jgi:hypothetical protein
MTPIHRKVLGEKMKNVLWINVRVGTWGFFGFLIATRHCQKNYFQKQQLSFPFSTLLRKETI